MKIYYYQDYLFSLLSLAGKNPTWKITGAIKETTAGTKVYLEQIDVAGKKNHRFSQIE